MARTYNLFISHSWSYSDQYNRLVSLLNARGYWDWKDYSVPRYDPIHTSGTNSELVEAIKRKMQPCHIVLIISGVYASYSKWIDKEITIAKGGFTYGKPILAIRPWGAQRISATAEASADETVGWNTESVVGAIRRLG